MTPLASKKSSVFSQYSRPEETPVFVSQVSVMLSRTSSRVRLPTGSPSKALAMSSWLCASWSSIQAARATGESASPYSVCGRVPISIA